MTKLLTRAVVIGAVLGFASAVHAQSDVTAPGDAIVPVDLDGTVGSSPGGEPVANAINNQRIKYLNFGEPTGATSELNTGLIVTPTLGSTIGGTVVTGLRLYTANDAEPRDPASYALAGSVTGVGGPWIPISSGTLALPTGRNLTSAPFSGTTPINPATDFLQTVTFANLVPYTSYRLVFPTVKDPVAANSMQIAEVELLGVAIPEPSTFALAGAGLLGLIVALRRRRS
ncbi:MAG: PEP-CTERM sorting domain-containing protein [Pirellulales bacterium]